MKLKRRTRKCEECPWSGRVSEIELEGIRCAAGTENQEFPCHMDDRYGDGKTSCRGHWEAKRYAEKLGLEPLSEEEANRYFDVLAQTR